MKIEDVGFIISIRKFEENSLLIKILSKENSIISGYIKYGKRQQHQIGNFVNFTWSSRKIENLGSLSIDLIKSYSADFMFNRIYLNLINLIVYMINNLLYEKFYENKLYIKLEIIFDLIKNKGDIISIIKEYLLFENILLNILGTGIIFDGKTKLQDLYYISPKTGLAVSEEVGRPYKDKLLTFPKIFKYGDANNDEILKSFETVNYFLKRYLSNNFSSKSDQILLLKEKLITATAL